LNEEQTRCPFDLDLPIVNSHFRYQSSTQVLDKKLDRVLEPLRCSICTSLFMKLSDRLRNSRPSYSRRLDDAASAAGMTWLTVNSVHRL